MNLIEALGKENYNSYRKKFNGWESREMIIDDVRAFWEIKDPGSKYTKVCLYRDGNDMFIYGDYGRYSFNAMTWGGSVYNLRYDNLGYQMEKLSPETREQLTFFDEDICEHQIREWLVNKLVSEFGMDKEFATALVFCDTDEFRWLLAKKRYETETIEEELFRNFGYLLGEEGTIDDLITAINSSPLNVKVYSSEESGEYYIDVYVVNEAMAFALEAIASCWEGESHFKSFLYDTEFFGYAEELQEEEVGYTTDSRFYIALTALQVCGEQLKAKKFLNETGAIKKQAFEDKGNECCEQEEAILQMCR